MKLTKITATGTALAAAALLSVGVAGAAPAHAASTAATSPSVFGTLQSGYSTTAPTTLTLSTKSGTVSVSVSSTTTFVRLDGSASSLSELSAGDKILATGTSQSSTAFTATKVRDTSLMRATIAGTVTAVNGSTVTMTPQRLKVAHRLRVVHRAAKILHPVRAAKKAAAPIPSVTFTLSSTTPVTLANKAAGTTSNVTTGTRVAVSGVFNRTSHTFISVSSVHILK